MPSYNRLGSGRKCCSKCTSSGDGDSDRDGIVGSIVLAFHTQIITTSKEKTCTRIKCAIKRNYNGF